jgi:lipopolysaccharide export system protein LptA
LATSVTGADKITIEADFLSINNKTNISTYKGNVVLNKKDLQIKGDSLTLVQNKNKKIIKFNIKGVPAEFINVSKKIAASAKEIIFNSSTEILHMTGDATLKTTNKSFNSNKIIYNTQTQNFTAGNKKTDNDKKGRVKIIIDQ